MSHDRHSDVEQWLSCPECGSDNVAARNPSLYISVFECEDCEERLERNW